MPPENDARSSKDEMLKRVREHFGYVDETALIVLKGHLLIEESLNSIISKYVFHPEFVEMANLGFAQKVCIARAVTLTEHKNEMFALRFFEIQADQSIVHLKDLICEHRHSVERNRHKRRVTTFRLQLTEMPHVHRCRLTSHLQKSVLVNFSSPVRRNANASQRAEAI
jgi:hypothetical protein